MAHPPTLKRSSDLRRYCDLAVVASSVLITWLNPNLASPSPRSDVYRSGTLSCLALRLRRKVALLKMLPSLAKTDLAHILLRSGRRGHRPDCGLSRSPRSAFSLGAAKPRPPL